MERPRYEILKVLEVLSDLLTACETYCIADCCGMDAFELDDKLVITWVENVGIERAMEARRQLDALLEQAKRTDCDLAWCPRVNLTGTPPEVASWLEVFSGMLDAAGVPQMTAPEVPKLSYPPAVPPKAQITPTESPAA